ncbi:MAG: hypothetical protein ACKVTZ_09145 [Bacteroidia bacterium]
MKVRLLLLVWVNLFCIVLGQAHIPTDYLASHQLEQGKKYLSQNDFQNASTMFETALQRPYNQLTTTCLYLAGVAAYYKGDKSLAARHFDGLLEQYPLSRYYYDAFYHKALLYIDEEDRVEKQFQGLKMLYELRSSWVDDSLRMKSEAAIFQYIYHVLPWNVTAIYYYYTENERFKQETLEAICYHKLTQIGRFDARKFYDKHLAEGGENSPFLDIMLQIPHYASHAGPKRGMSTQPSDLELAESEIQVAVMLPFFVDPYQTDTMQNLPERSRMAIELYEGMLDAIGEYAQNPNHKKITFKVFDTQKDSELISSQLVELSEWKPQIVVGEIYNRPSRVISAWADSNDVVQIIPISPNRNLVENHSNVFILRPSPATHGKKMAEFAYRDLGLRNVSVWTNGRTVTNDLAHAFQQQFQLMGGRTTLTEIDSVFDRAAGTIQQEVGKLKYFDGVYLPIPDETTQGLVLSLIDVNNFKKLKIMSLPDFEEYEKIDRDLKERYKVYFSSSYFPIESSEDFQNYIRLHFENYRTYPSEFNIRGYDLGKYLISILENYNPAYQNLTQLIRDNLNFSGLHQNINFDREYENQAIHVIQHTAEGTILVK